MASRPSHRLSDQSEDTSAADATSATPADAVRVRTALAAGPSVRLRVRDTTTDLVNAHAVLPDGTIVLAVDALTPLGGLLVAVRGREDGVRLEVVRPDPTASTGSPAQVRVTAVGVVRRFDPALLDDCDHDTVMALLDLPPVALWAVDPGELHLDGDGTPTPVTVEAYRAAAPHPVPRQSPPRPW